MSKAKELMGKINEGKINEGVKEGKNILELRALSKEIYDLESKKRSILSDRGPKKYSVLPFAKVVENDVRDIFKGSDYEITVEPTRQDVSIKINNRDLRLDIVVMQTFINAYGMTDLPIGIVGVSSFNRLDDSDWKHNFNLLVEPDWFTTDLDFGSGVERHFPYSEKLLRSVLDKIQER